MSLFTILVLALSISMDAFSLSLIYGTINMKRKNKLTLSLIVGIFHFIMPLLGMFLGDQIVSLLHIEIHIVLTVILLFIGTEMVISSFKQENKLMILNIKGMLLFALAVSIDSFTLGTGLKAINDNYLMVAIVFFLTSAIMTFTGLSIGEKISKNIGHYATLGGGLVLILLALILNFF
ncbi:MAG: manganese efflux pump [Bacilli bacterium]|nr:manganese efflux pump [Bacilli bacterium]MDD4547370.1 manganese efflux pump [Bacilli bacterium]